jgi:Predicted metal-dependent hydrolase of the TIM-barrel fold
MSREKVSVSVIDVHHHAILPSVPATLERLALPGSGGRIPVPPWSIQQDREAMARLGITGVLLSMPGSGTPEEVRAFNTSLAQFSQEDPSHYGLLANLPYGDAEAAVEEIGYVLDTLHGDGFALPSNYEGIYISDGRLDAVLAELDRRSAVVFVHPGAPDRRELAALWAQYRGL